MLINDIDNLSVTLEETEDTDIFITVIIKNSDTDEEVGRLRILKTRYDSFLLTLSTMIREVYSVFEDRQSALSKLENKISGSIKFIGD